MDFLNPLFEAIGWLLAQLYSVIPNLGISIILLTFIIMLILYPLTAKQAKSMIAMQRVQPEVKRLQAKYKGDRQKLNEEMMKFYQENKINPLAGCLPLLVQLPIFFSLFRVLRDPEKYVPTDSSLYHALCDGVKGACNSDTINHLKFLGMDLQLSATDAHSSVIAAAPYFILVGLVILTGFMQTRQAQKRTPAANKQMAMVMKVLPIFFGLISLQFPAGLVLYFFVSNLWRLGQQEVIFRRHGSALTPAKDKSGATAGAIEADSRVVDEAGDVEDAEVVDD
ncbi:MAG: YidC/Oxa1 family membrane protein insertase, partial [Acidimicrobiia bacterium]